MFVLVEMQYNVRIPPWKFNINLIDAITEEINKKLANKVVINVGLCITLCDLLEMGDSFILPGDGASFTKVRFHYIVFRPFIEEILVGKIKSSSQEGVIVSLEFFDDILIAPDHLQYPSRFDESDQVWVWEYESDDGKHDLTMEPGEEIRFRVTSENFCDTSPVGPSTTESSEPNETEKKAPYSLVGSVAESGLGLLTWWN